MPTTCIDISNWQGKVKKDVWEKNSDSIPCVILRTSYTEMSEFDLHEDASFGYNLKTAYRAGLAVGAYHYSQAISETEARKEAKFAVSVIKKYEEKYNAKITLPVACDWEFGKRLNSYVAGKMGKQRCKQIIDAFCRVIRNAGYTPMVYANLSTLNGYIASDIYKDWLIWVAQYNSRCDYKHPYYMWQYSSSGKVSGIPGRIDMNKLYGQSIVSEPTKKEKYPYTLPELPKRGWFTSGDTGSEVKRLQRFLNWYGDYGLKVDGEVGRQTINAVRMYQGRENLKVDGCFGTESLERAKTVKR